MMMSQELLFAGLHAVGLVAICTMAYGWFQRFVPHRIVRQLAIGGLLGTGAALSMTQPYIMMDGYQADSRNLFLAISAAFGGALSTLVSLTIAGLFRISMSGHGVLVGVATMTIACISAAIWTQSTRSKRRRSWKAWVMLGAILSAPSLVIMAVFDLMDPSVVAARIAADMIGAVFFGRMFESELRRGNRERQLNLEASTDPLTGLPNRRALMDFIDHISPSERESMALLVVDADHFKSINDQHGHDVGDEVLKMIASSLSASIRQGDFAARFGGEEFAVLLRVNRPENGYEMAERLRRELSGFHEVSGKRINVTVSVGRVSPATDKVRLSESVSPGGCSPLYGQTSGTKLRGLCLIRLPAAKQGGSRSCHASGARKLALKTVLMTLKNSGFDQLAFIRPSWPAIRDGFRRSKARC